MSVTTSSSERWVQRGCLAQVNASTLSGPRVDDTAQDWVDRGLIACTATDTHDATHRVPSSIWNEWGENLTREES
jgi:tyrosine-protein phosphatase YwqE